MAIVPENYFTSFVLSHSEVKDGYKQVNKDEIDGLIPDGIGERLHHRENCRNPGYIIFTVSVCMYYILV